MSASQTQTLVANRKLITQFSKKRKVYYTKPYLLNESLLHNFRKKDKNGLLHKTYLISKKQLSVSASFTSFFKNDAEVW